MYYSKSFLISLFTATLLIAGYRYPADGHDGESTAYHRLIESFEGDYKPLDSMDPPSRPDSNAISAYDGLIRQEAAREGLDWRLLSAIAYHESRFDAQVVSRRGAKGLMQIMPSTARQFGIPAERIMEPRTNIRLAAKLIRRIEKSLRLPASVDQKDKTNFVLACYNGGIGHVTDARNLASKYGGDPNKWDDVATYLRLKAEPEYGNDDVVKCGTFNGSDQTLAFVKNVTGKYSAYCRKAQL